MHIVVLCTFWSLFCRSTLTYSRTRFVLLSDTACLIQPCFFLWNTQQHTQAHSCMLIVIFPLEVAVSSIAGSALVSVTSGTTRIPAWALIAFLWAQLASPPLESQQSSLCLWSSRDLLTAMATAGASGTAVLLGRLLLDWIKGAGLALTAASGRFWIKRDCASQWVLCCFKILSLS